MSEQDAEFKTMMIDRIALYEGRRRRLQDRVDELTEELNLADDRLRRAIDLYEAEFREPAPRSLDPTARGQLALEQSGLNGPLTGLSWADAIEHVLREHRRPLHVKEIWSDLQGAGFHTNARDPLRSIVAVVLRKPAFVRAGANTYALRDLLTESEPHHAPGREEERAAGKP